jgi:tetratricopeptide (TPR) repeat protein
LSPLKLTLLAQAAALIIIIPSCRHNVAEPEAQDSKQTAQALVEKADNLYEGREDLNRVRAGVSLLRQARVADFRSYEAAWRLAKFDYYVGSHTDNSSERDNAFREGIEAGRDATKLKADGPEGHFWLGASYGGEAQTGVIAGLSSLDDIRQEMETVLRLDERYEGASAYMVLGQVEMEVPRVLGGDVKKAIDYLEKGAKLAPNNSMLKLRLAEALVKAKDFAQASRVVTDILQIDVDPKYLPEHKEVLGEAAKLQDKISHLERRR